MITIEHKFKDHEVDANTKILILGTFNPGIEDGPDFFYGRPKNYLWELLPVCFNQTSLKEESLEFKKEFMLKYHIDFADIIHSVVVPVEKANNVSDIYIDNKVKSWKEIKELIDGLKYIEAVYFTRITFQGIPNIHQKVKSISQHCINREKKIRFSLLETPSRFINAKKQQHWSDIIIRQTLTIHP